MKNKTSIGDSYMNLLGRVGPDIGLCRIIRPDIRLSDKKKPDTRHYRQGMPHNLAGIRQKKQDPAQPILLRLVYALPAMSWGLRPTLVISKGATKNPVVLVT